MSVVHIHTATLSGSQVLPVTIEVDIQRGLPFFSVIGLPDKQIEEARDRVRAAIKNSGFSFPLGKITVNLSPSSVQKQGTHFDLGIALGILAASHSIPVPAPTIWVFGELSLSGEVVRCNHLVTLLLAAVKEKLTGCIVPAGSMNQATLVPDCLLHPTSQLMAVVSSLQKGISFRSYSPPRIRKTARIVYALDGIIGQATAKRVLSIALAGRHRLLLTGPAGSGKSELAKAAVQLLPMLTPSELLVVAELYSYAGEKFDLEAALPPYRAPLPSSSPVQMLGGGSSVVPGELSLAHHGVLFLDEFPSFSKPVLDALRVPLQEKRVVLVRGGKEYRFPAHGTVIAAQNPCPCGWYGVAGESCRCKPGEIQRYRATLSEPILDRFDLFCDLPRVDGRDWKGYKLPRELSGTALSRQIQKARSLPPPSFTSSALDTVVRAANQYRMSGRAVHSLQEVSASIAKMGNFHEVREEHVQEALLYRQRPAII